MSQRAVRASRPTARSSYCRRMTSCSAARAVRATSGCRFPADYAYAGAITADAARIGAELARKGVLGRFAVDFVVARAPSGGWSRLCNRAQPPQGRHYASLSDASSSSPMGRYDPETALFTAPGGREKHLVASDHFESDLLRGFSVDDLFDVAVRHRLHFDQARQSGVMFHMLSAITELGRIGLTAVGDSREQAESIFRHAERVILEEARPRDEPALPAV